MNILLAHASGAPIPTNMGRQRVDFQEVVQVALQGGARSVYFPVIERLAHKNLIDAVRQTHPRATSYKLKQFVAKAKGLLEQLLESMEDTSPPISREDIDAARQLFKENERDL